MLDGQRRRELRDFSRDIAVAWHQAAFARANKLPDLEKIQRAITGKLKPARAQSPKELLAVIRKWNRELGGEDHLPPGFGEEEE